MSFEKNRYEIFIRESHLDTFGHVNNATYLQILEEARWDFITARGFGLKKIQEVGLGPIILEINMKFLKEIKLREKITVESQTLSYEKKIGFLRQDMLNEKNEICFEALLTFGFFDTKLRKLVPPNAEWLHAIGKNS